MQKQTWDSGELLTLSVRATLPYALNVFEGAQLTQLLQVVAAGRLLLICEGQ